MTGLCIASGARSWRVTLLAAPTPAFLYERRPTEKRLQAVQTALTDVTETAR